MEHEANSDQLPDVHIPKIPAIVIVIIIVLVIVGIIVGGWYMMSNRRVEFEDSAAPLYEATYSPLEKKLVSGDVVGTISGGSFVGRTLSFCTEKNGNIVKEGGRRYMECNKDDVKQVTISDKNTFEIRLRPNTYIFNLELKNKEKSDKLPGRVEVKTGQKAAISLSIE